MLLSKGLLARIHTAPFQFEASSNLESSNHCQASSSLEACRTNSATFNVAQAAHLVEAAQVRGHHSAALHSAGNIAPCVWQNTQLPPAGIATGTPLLMLTEKNFRLLIHALAILHARSVFASASVIAATDRLLRRDQALIKSLKLQNYLTRKSKADMVRMAGRTANHLAVALTDEKDEKTIKETIESYQLNGFTVIDATDADINQVTISSGCYRVPMLDPQILANLLNQFLMRPDTGSDRQTRRMHLV